jgi:hypothetical protein
MLSSSNRSHTLRDDRLLMKVAHQLVSQAHAKSKTRGASAIAWQINSYINYRKMTKRPSMP